MKRRILSLALCALMLLTVFLVGCGERSVDEIIADIAASAKQPYTLSLWIPTNDSTTPEAVQAVEDAINVILRKEFSTSIELHAIKDSEYEATVAAKLNEIQSLLDNGATPANMIEHKTQVVKTEEGTYETVYFPVEDTQLDIFLTRTEADYTKYVSEGKIASIQSFLDGAYRNLNKVIFPTLMDGIKKNGSAYGLPVNHVIGEYTLAVVDKALATEYGLSADAATLADLNDFIVWAKDRVDVALSAAKEDINEADVATFEALVEAGCVGTSDKAAVRIVKGDFVDLENYRKDALVIKYKMPVATTEDIFSSVLVISTFSIQNNANPRAIEFLDYLNTNVELKTLLQYGIEGVHYQLNYAEDDLDLSDPTLEIISDAYSMNTLYTGNVYKTFRGEGVTMADSWVVAKEQNLDCAPLS